MLRRLLPFALTAALLCPMTAFAQAPAVQPPTAAPVNPIIPLPKKHSHVGGKISAVDAVAKTITLTHGKKNDQTTLILSVPDGTKIYKVGDAKGMPTGTFTDLTLDTRINAAVYGDEIISVAKTIHIHAPKTATPSVP